jgi:hypothetical protein
MPPILTHDGVLQAVRWRVGRSGQETQRPIRHSFLFIGAEPNTDWLNGSGIALDGTSYLFALVGGKLARVADNFTTMSGRQVALHIYVEPASTPWTRASELRRRCA